MKYKIATCHVIDRWSFFGSIWCTAGSNCNTIYKRNGTDGLCWRLPKYSLLHDCDLFTQSIALMDWCRYAVSSTHRTNKPRLISFWWSIIMTTIRCHWFGHSSWSRWSTCEKCLTDAWICVLDIKRYFRSDCRKNDKETFYCEQFIIILLNVTKSWSW